MAASFVPDYFLPLFAEDVYYKKGANRSGDSCLAIKSDLNPQTLSVRSQKLPLVSGTSPLPSFSLSFSLSFYRVSASPSRLRTKPNACIPPETFLANKQIAKWAVTPTPVSAKKGKERSNFSETVTFH